MFGLGKNNKAQNASVNIGQGGSASPLAPVTGSVVSVNLNGQITSGTGHNNGAGGVAGPGGGGGCGVAHPLLNGAALMGTTYIGTSSFLQPNPDFAIHSALNAIIRETFLEKRGEDFCQRLIEELETKKVEVKKRVIANVFSDDAINSYRGLDNDELFNFLALTI